MSIPINLAVTIQRTENSERIFDFSYTETQLVDAQHCFDTEFPAGITDEQIDLYESSLVVRSTYLFIETDIPIQVKLDSAANTPIDVTSQMLLTDDATVLFVTVPGTENANVKFVYGGMQT
jgi:hypothetical protein